MIQYSGLVRRIKKSEARVYPEHSRKESGLCRCPRINVVVLLSKKGNDDGSGSELKDYVKYKMAGNEAK